MLKSNGTCHGGDIQAENRITSHAPSGTIPPSASASSHPSALDRVGNGSPRKTTITLLVLFLVGTCSRGYGFYAQAMRNADSSWTSILQGTASAPEQYRIGVIFLADGMSRLLHLKISQAFGILDLAGSLLAALLLYRMLEAKPIYRAAPNLLRWFASACFLALTLYYIDWTSWYQKVATLPTAGAVALMLWLWTPGERPATSARRAGIVLGFFLLAIAQAFVRADVAILICAGLFLASLLRISPNLSLPRGTALALTAFTAMAVAGVQVYLMKVRYPLATYGDVPVFMLKHDFKRPTEWVSWYIFMAPFLWTAMRAARRRFAVEGAGAAFLFAGLAYIPVWLVLGRLDEVRIFIPMAIVIVPTTVELAMEWMQSIAASRSAVVEDV